MIAHLSTRGRDEAPPIPDGLTRLRRRIDALPTALRDELAPLAEEAAEDTVFLGRTISVARDGLERYRLDLAIVRFDLEATRREREALRARLEAAGS